MLEHLEWLEGGWESEEILFLKKLSDVSFTLPPFSGSTPTLLVTGIEPKHILLSQPISKYLQLLNFYDFDSS